MKLLVYLLKKISLVFKTITAGISFSQSQTFFLSPELDVIILPRRITKLEFRNTALRYKKFTQLNRGRAKCLHQQACAV